MSALREKLQQEFLDEEYRYAYDEEFANSRMATQIKVIREQTPLTQAELAERAGMKQSRISTLENVNYSAWSISTLRRLARALGVRLSFKFESWGEMLPEVESFSRESLQRPPFEKDPAFQPQNSEKDQFEKKAATPDTARAVVVANITSSEVKTTAQGIITATAGAGSLTVSLIGTTVILGKSAHGSAFTFAGDPHKGMWQPYFHGSVGYRPIDNRESLKDAEPIPTIGNISIAVGPIAGELTILQQAAH